jgi:hypothetical protein
MTNDNGLSVLVAMVLLVFGLVFGVAALVSAYHTAGQGASSLGLGIATAGLALSAAICFALMAWLVHPGAGRGA